MPRKRKLPPNVSAFIDRHGKERFRFRKVRHPVRYFEHHPLSKEGRLELEEFQRAASVGNDLAKAGSINALLSRYYASAAFNSAGEGRRAKNRARLDAFATEFGDDLVTDFTFEHIDAILMAAAKRRVINGRKAGGPGAAYELRKQLNRAFAFAEKISWISKNPVQMSERVKVPKTGGFHTWTEREIQQYQKRHPLGSTARLALEIMLWTGQRRGDARLFGPRHVVGGRVEYRQGKTGKTVWLPIAPPLKAALAAMAATGLQSFLITEFGKPFSAAGFGNKMRQWCDEAGLPQCSAHGLRKAIGRRMAESMASQQAMKAVGGWSGDSEVATYAADANKANLAEQTINDLANRFGYPPASD